MAEQVQKALEVAQNRAAEAEANMMRAAQAGKQLLEQLQESEKIKEILTQEKHALKLTLQSKEHAEAAMHDEILELTKRLKSNESSEKSAREMSKEIDDMKATFARKEEDFQETIESYKAKLFQADEKLAANVPLPDSPNVSSTFDPEAFIELRDEVDLLKDQVDRFREDNSRLKAENEESSFSTHSLRLQISELKESLEDKEGELASYRDSMRQAKEELQMMQLEEDDDDMKVEVAPKGNSLFSEVEDRRHVAEEQLKKYKNKCEAMKIIHDKRLTEMQKLRMQNIHLMNMTSSNGGAGKSEQAHLERLQELLQTERNKFKMLTDQLTINNSEMVVVSKNEFSSKKAAENHQELLNQLQRQMRQNLEDGEKLQELSKLTGNLERQMAKLKSENIILRMRLNEKNQNLKKTSSTTISESKASVDEIIVENVFFEKKVEKSEISKFPANLDQEDIQENNVLKVVGNKENKKPKKSVNFFDVNDTTAEKEDLEQNDAGDKKKSGKKKMLPRIRDERQVINAEEECEKMNQQCNQQ